MEIAKAVVLAADCCGSTPWPSVGLAARQLAPVANRPVLFHHLDALKDAGVSEAAIVTDVTTRGSIQEAVGDGSEWGLALIHLEHDGTPNVLTGSAIADFVGSAPVIVHHGDVLLRERLAAIENDFADDHLDALILRPAGGADGVQRTRDAAGYIIGPHVHESLRAETAALDQVLERLRAAGNRVRVREVDACMPCRGGVDELLRANRRMLEQLAPEHRGERVFDSQIQGSVALHPSAHVRSSVIRGPVAIGPGARIDDSYVGPYTSIGSDVQIDGVEIEHSIVLDRAQLRFLGTRIEGSLVGPDARIVRDFHMPQAIRLSVGAGAEVALS